MQGMESRSTSSWAASTRLYIRMTRPAFLLLTVAGCLLGTATAAACGCGFDMTLAASTIALAVIAHAAGNVLNDLHDARNGTDGDNPGRISPFTGGSQLIQQGKVTERQTAELAWALMIFLVPAGLLLAVKTGPGVLLLGMAGLSLAWAYSAPPLQLMSRGWGEVAVGMAWFLVVIGADYVQRRQFFPIPASAAFSFGLLAAALLLINSFPDADADRRAAKATTVVRLGANGACALYWSLVLLAHGWLVLSVVRLIPPAQALWGLSSLPLSIAAAILLTKHRRQPSKLKPALGLTVTAALAHALGMAWGFIQVALQH